MPFVLLTAGCEPSQSMQRQTAVAVVATSDLSLDTAITANLEQDLWPERLLMSVAALHCT